MSYLAQKLPSFLRRLHLYWQSQREGYGPEIELVESCRFFVVEDTSHDNLDGGMTGHDLVLFVPEAIMAAMSPKDQSSREDFFRQAIGELIPRSAHEYLNDLNIQLADDNDSECQQAIPYSVQPVIKPEAVSFWEPGQVRLFISHKDEQKAGAKELAEALKSYGVSAFVAHDTIKPLRDWKDEIMNGLRTMEVMVVYLTDEFENSYWCQQEVGFALGKGVPIISLRLEKKDPPGFISSAQAAKGHVDHPAASAGKIYELIGEALGASERLNNGLVSAFINSSDFDEVRTRFDRMSRSLTALTPKQLKLIIDGYANNPTLSGAYYLANQYNRLAKFLSSVTGRQFSIHGRVISELDPDLDEDVPF